MLSDFFHEKQEPDKTYKQHPRASRNPLSIKGSGMPVLLIKSGGLSLNFNQKNIKNSYLCQLLFKR
jgi:hypothetical protein